MDVDLSRLSEDELLALNRRIVERLRLLHAARRLSQLANFTVGLTVEFDTDDGRRLRGTITRLNRQTATILTSGGQWRVSPSRLRAVDAETPAAGAARVVRMPDGCRRA